MGQRIEREAGRAQEEGRRVLAIVGRIRHLCRHPAMCYKTGWRFAYPAYKP